MTPFVRESYELLGIWLIPQVSVAIHVPSGTLQWWFIFGLIVFTIPIAEDGDV